MQRGTPYQELTERSRLLPPACSIPDLWHATTGARQAAAPSSSGRRRTYTSYLRGAYLTSRTWQQALDKMRQHIQDLAPAYRGKPSPSLLLCGSVRHLGVLGSPPAGWMEVPPIIATIPLHSSPPMLQTLQNARPPCLLLLPRKERVLPPGQHAPQCFCSIQSAPCFASAIRMSSQKQTPSSNARTIRIDSSCATARCIARHPLEPENRASVEVFRPQISTFRIEAVDRLCNSIFCKQDN